MSTVEASAATADVTSATPRDTTTTPSTTTTNTAAPSDSSAAQSAQSPNLTNPIEMDSLPSAQPPSSQAPTHGDAPALSPLEQPTSLNDGPSTTSLAPPVQKPDPLTRSETAEVALGPDGAALSTAATDSSDPVLRITLMLITGARHPYAISNKYLTSRKVTALDDNGNFDPREMSAYKLKELIWTDWRPEWEPKPRDPGAIRLIILGRMLDDKSQLKDLPFTLASTNVVHMTVKPADLIDDDADTAGKSATKSTRGRGRDDGESAGCCRCVIL